MHPDPSIRARALTVLQILLRHRDRRAADAGTLLEEIHAQIPDLDTVVVAVGGGLFAGVATAAQQHGIRTVAVEPEPGHWTTES